MKDWQTQAVALMNTGTMTDRDISRVLNVPRSTINDYLRKYRNALYVESDNEVLEYPEINIPYEGKDIVETEKVFKIITDPTKQEGTHLFVPDCQVKPNISMNYLVWLGKYIVRKKPDVIVFAGDFADFESLSSYDKGKRSAEGKRVKADIDAAIQGMKLALQELYNLQQKQLKEKGFVEYKPRLVMTLGNHEARLNRYVDENPSLHGFLTMDSLKYKEFGFEVYDFLTPVTIGGITYCHYFQNVMTGKPLSGSALNMLKTLGRSFSQGHKQTLDVATRFLQVDGSQQWGLIAGAYYEHDEDYKGVMGNHHWRGLIVKHNVQNGSYDPLFVSMEWLKNEYGTEKL